jgi:hypothetical protein
LENDFEKISERKEWQISYFTDILMFAAPDHIVNETFKTKTFD